MRTVVSVALFTPVAAIGAPDRCIDAERLGAQVDCFADPTCTFAERFPEEYERQTRSMARVTHHVMSKLKANDACIPYEDLHAGLDGSDEPCSTHKAEAAFALYDLIRSGVVSASIPSDLPASTYMLAENGICN